MDIKERLLVTSSPHLRKGMSTAATMWTVSACLTPAALWGVLIYGLPSLFVLLISAAAAVLTEYVITRLQGKFTVWDGSAFLTGLLIGMNMPPAVPGFIPVVASVFAIAVVKQTFGGLGRNWMNPALAGRVFVLFSWTSQMTTWSPPRYTALTGLLGGSRVDALSGATPLSQGSESFLAAGGYRDLLIGNIPGCIGEVSALLLILGFIVLLFLDIANWQVPLSYLGSFALFTWAFGGIPGETGLFSGDPLFHLLSGGLMLGALFMATDLVTSPMTAKGMVIFGIGTGVLTFIIRFFGGLPEGVSLAIILMNMSVPLIDRVTKPLVFGYRKAQDE